MTANAMASDQEACLAAGMVDFIPKPVDPEVLFRALLRWIKPRLGADDMVPLINLPELEPEKLASLPGIPGLDQTIGLRRVLGKPERYISMLRGFADSQAGAVNDIRRALAAQDPATATRVAHTLKGLAGNIASTDLQNAALAVDQALRAGNAAAQPALLDTLASALAKQIAAIVKALPEEPHAASLQAIDPEKLNAVCQQLTALLTEDGNAERLLKENADLLKAAFPKHFVKLHAAVTQFDSERGLAILQDAMGQSQPVVALPTLPDMPETKPVAPAAAAVAAPFPALEPLALVPPDAPPAAAPKSIGSQELETICQQLTLLLANDKNAGRLLNENANKLKAAFPQHFADLQAAVNQFDGERGLVILQDAMRKSKQAGTDV